MERDKAPALRFQSFNGSWTESKIGDVTTYVDYRGATPPKSGSGVFLVTAKNVKAGYIDYECSKEYIAKESYDEVMRRGRPLLGDVLITTEAPLGNVAAIDRLDVALAQRIIKLRGKESVLSNDFLKHILLSKSFQKNLNAKSSGSTAKGIKGSVLHKLTLVFPSLAEQQTIAAFLSAVDEKLRQLGKKKELLLRYKKGVMQQIFDQNLRFRDEDGNDFSDWIEGQISSVCDILYGKNQKEVIDERGKYPILGTGGEIGRTNEFLYDKPSVLIGRKGTIDKPRFMDTPFWTVDTLFYTRVHENVVPKWLFYQFQMINWYRHNEASGVPSLSAPTVSKIRIRIPEKSEQEHIASFLSAIDEKIFVVDLQIQKIKSFKSGLLQQMFV